MFVNGIVTKLNDQVAEPLDMPFAKVLIADMMQSSFYDIFDKGFAGCGITPFKQATEDYKFAALAEFAQSMNSDGEEAESEQAE